MVQRELRNSHFSFSARNANKLTDNLIAFQYVSDESTSGRISGRHTTMGERTLIPSLLTMNLQAVHKITSLIRLTSLYIHRYLFLLN